MLLFAHRGLQAGRVNAGAPDLTHAINTNLAFFVGSHPPGALLGKELISNASFLLVGSAAFTGDHPTLAGWKCLRNLSATADAAYLATTPAGLTGLSTVWTMWADIQIDIDLVDGVASAVLVAPLNVGWTANFAKLMWAKSNTTNRAFSFMRNVGVNNDSTLSGAASFPTTGRYRVAVVRNSTNYKFYLNGTQAGTDETGAATAIDWSGTDRGITLLNRHFGSPGEGMAARLLGLRVWSRALSTTEISNLNTNPQLGIIV